MPVARPNGLGDFLFDPKENPKEFDAVHTFTVVRQVVTMYTRALRRTSLSRDFDWQWGSSSPLQVYPRGGLEANAYYSRKEKCLRFFYFHPNNDESSPLVYTCRSFDIVAHETGHAVLDALRPGYLSRNMHPQTGGLHESFGDLTAIFTMLAQMDQCEAIIAESKCNLHAKTFFSSVAEQFGEALYGHRLGLRNADNDFKMSDVSNQVHEISQVFTGAIYDIIADLFQDRLAYEKYDPAETLFRVGKHMTSLVVCSIVSGPEKNATFSDIAKKMIEIEPKREWKPIIQNHFEAREILEGSEVAMHAATDGFEDLSFSGCCGTLLLPNFGV